MLITVKIGTYFNVIMIRFQEILENDIQIELVRHLFHGMVDMLKG